MNQFLLQTSWWIPLYGLLGAVLTLPWSVGLIRRTGPRPAVYLNLLMTFLALIHGTAAFNVTLNQPAQLIDVNWFHVADLDLSFALTISPVSMGAMEVVTGLSFLAQLFALGYLEKDWALARFYALMGLFEGAMACLALSNSLFLSYALLELLTLSTYFLVGFWYAQPLVVTAARDAFLTKRVGDLLLFMGVIALATLAGDLDFNHLYEWVETCDLNPILANLLGLALIAGPTGKCAQFPLHLWLDEAMEGPNPASILRNSVVVACGAYVLIQLQPILAIAPLALDTLVVLGTMTAIGASLVSLAQIDIKRALAHSTSAYLGLVFIAVGMQWTNFALLVLFAHAFAKALLFMSIGSVISTTNTQDLTEMGGLWSRMPATTIAFLIGSLGMVGLLPLGNFWAMERGLDIFWYDQPVLVLVILAVNLLTALNLTRVFRLVFLGDAQPKTRRTPEIPWAMAVPMVSLTIVTLLVPLILWRLGLLPSWRYLNQPAMIALLLSSFVGYWLGGRISLSRVWSRSIQVPVKFMQDLLAYDFYVDRLYRISVVFAVNSLSRFSNWFDRYIVDGMVNLAGLTTVFSAESLKYSAPGQAQFYALVIVVSTVTLGIFMNWALVNELFHTVLSHVLLVYSPLTRHY